MDTSGVIKANLKALGESYDALRPFMLKRLEAVEALLQKKRTAQQEALAALKEADFSLAAISRESQISRTTLYNHGQLLKRYIEYSAKQADAEDPFAQLERAALDKADLQAQIALFMERDLDAELLKHENGRLTREVEEQQKEILRLHSKIMELNREIMDLKQRTGVSRLESKATLSK